MPERKRNRRPLLRWAAFFVVLTVFGVGVNQALLHPDTPLPPEWNPSAPFDVADAPSPLTEWKIRGLMATPGRCEAALETHARVQDLEPLIASETCGIAQRVNLSAVGGAQVRPFETTCEIALRLALWEEHRLAPAAQRLFGQGIREIRHFGSYSCRRIRTSSGTSNRWSTHASARAVDISGFVLDDGTLIDLRRDWGGSDAAGHFLREAQDSACEMFGLVLGPEYNALHADHFHIQLDWDGCR